MGIFDKAKDALGDNPDQVESGIEKAADFPDQRTQADQIDPGADHANDSVTDYLRPADEADSTPSPSESIAPPAGSPEPPD